MKTIDERAAEAVTKEVRGDRLIVRLSGVDVMDCGLAGHAPSESFAEERVALEVARIVTAAKIAAEEAHSIALVDALNHDRHRGAHGVDVADLVAEEVARQLGERSVDERPWAGEWHQTSAGEMARIAAKCLAAWVFEVGASSFAPVIYRLDGTPVWNGPARVTEQEAMAAADSAATERDHLLDWRLRPSTAAPVYCCPSCGDRRSAPFRHDECDVDARLVERPTFSPHLPDSGMCQCGKPRLAHFAGVYCRDEDAPAPVNGVPETTVREAAFRRGFKAGEKARLAAIGGARNDDRRERLRLLLAHIAGRIEEREQAGLVTTRERGETSALEEALRRWDAFDAAASPPPVAAPIDATDAAMSVLREIAKRLAAVNVLDADGNCPICGMDEGDDSHAFDCPWAIARTLFGEAPRNFGGEWSEKATAVAVPPVAAAPGTDGKGEKETTRTLETWLTTFQAGARLWTWTRTQRPAPK